MKKQLISMVVLLLVLQGCGSNSGNDKDVTEQDEGEYKLSFASFDRGADGIIDRNMTMTYNARGDVLTERTEWDHHDGDGKGVWLFTNNYSAEGDLITTTHLDNYNETLVTTYSYDEHGDGIKETQRDSDGEIESIDEYTYDEHHNILTESHDFDGDGVVDYITRYTYNENHKIVTEIETYDDEDIAHGIVSGDVRTYSYDDSGNLIEVVEKDEDGEITEQNIYTYDANNNRIKEVEQDEYDTVTTTYTYDKRGNGLTITEDSDSDGVIDERGTFSYTYTDDEKKVVLDIDKGTDGTIDDRYTSTWIKI